MDSTHDLSEPVEQVQVPNSVCPEPINTYVYIDDFNTVEKVRITDAESHITTNKRRIRILAKKSELQFERVRILADSLNMRVNNQKTQLLCIHANKDSIVDSYIRTEGDDITSTKGLKILGFHFDENPNAVAHVTQAINKFYNKLWTLRFLRRSGMDKTNLLKVYRTVILPSVEYCSEIYDSLIPKYMSDKLESVQRQAIRIIHGWNINIEDVMEREGIDSLQDRRTKACLAFANRAVKSRFGQKWFPRNPAARGARQTTRRIYEEKKARTERDRNNPIQHMIRLLNKQSSG